jgi:cytochrome c peroxidase
MIIIAISLLFSAWQWQLALSHAQQTDYALTLPEEVLEPIIPEDNPLTEAKIKLGKKLYFDKRLSADDSVSCATCHDPNLGFADGKAVAEGIQKKKGARNSPTVLNTAFFDFQFWDGRVETLEEQAKQPITNPVEMGMPSHDAVVKKLRGVPEYGQAFKQAFGTEDFTIDHVAKAIASFERTLNTLNSPFDRFFKGDKNAISAKAQLGWEVFQEKGRCITCHKFNASYPFFTDNKFHNIGVAMKEKDFEAYILSARKGVALDAWKH